MITEVTGNLLRDDAQALVNTVNTVGVMGKGLALQFKRAFPEVFSAYRKASEAGQVQPGRILAVPIPGDDDRWVLNFPTKRHWRQPSRIEDIEAGLDDLVRVLRDLDIRSVAVPPLGCGNGGLDWSVVRPLIIERLGALDVTVRLYGLGTPTPEDMPTSTARPELNRPRARLLAALHRYIRASWESGISDQPRASLIEIHKVAYLLQSAGADLGLSFVRLHYGPFSSALNQGLAGLEGHYLMGFGDGTGGARADLRLLPGAAEAAEAAVRSDAEFERAWEAVRRATLGYEYPEGMELLASVHYLAGSADRSADADSVVRQLAQWSDRKRRLFHPDTVRAALQRLDEAALLRRMTS
ncbi:type II toxin-antitoxin system antitoxin DNA ADP-ribosyl glycohydrolase DarG [Planomonospora parontospora]|uniref:type II toxin-antitoxin system antitoxin DNA ADP-ribosyl glycohydrolase DarG n=1 Tax=Planomonospora parontospora TaxID=58119 RepID=UPI0016701223|nr:macro domain-containing protein [Planomonospora parontospora]GGL33560.1 hypothetical protein GCM10014719_38440 [Planomonospora parontospora subsp. antibiotica]GII17163.1 hypothetical protein Ppa05_38890 [Planomonospora parontospora subsp. antibiotica]